MFMSIKRKIVLHAFVQSLFIVVISIAVSLTCNFFRSGPLPLIGEWSIEARLTTDTGESTIVTLKKAISLFNQQEAVFMDARISDQYAEGHIKGAINLPWHDVQERFMDVLPGINPDARIITYCDGETCNLSHDLALFLRDMGFKVNVLVNGWSVWQANGLPVELGAR